MTTMTPTTTTMTGTPVALVPDQPLTQPVQQEARMAERPDPETDIPVLTMVAPLVGFPQHQHFALTRLDDSGLICDLRSLEDPELRFIVVAPSPFFADYSPEVPDSVIEELGVESEEDLLALLVVTVGATADSATANLLAPVLVNHRTRLAGQYLLDDVDLPMRAPLSPVAASTSA